MYYVLTEWTEAVIDQMFKQGILHHDCSLFNGMIKDLKNGSHKFLLDWKFTIEITAQGKYNMGGTVCLSRLLYTMKLIELHMYL